MPVRVSATSCRSCAKRSVDTGPANSCRTRFASPTKPVIRNLFMGLQCYRTPALLSMGTADERG